MLSHCPSLSLTSLARAFWRPISLTWILTLLETALLVALPLLNGRAIEGLLRKLAVQELVKAHKMNKVPSLSSA